MTASQSDILVIGGGIAGVSVAARLAPSAKVTLLEAESALGYHASGRSAAVFEPNYGAPSVNALSYASAAYFDEGGYLSPRGVLIVARPHEETLFAADLIALGCTEITVSEAREMVPILLPDISCAGHHPEARDIDTDRLIQDFARKLRQHDGSIITGAHVSDIRRHDGLWHVTAGEIHTAKVLINAAGAWADDIARLAGVQPVNLTPFRRSMARIPAPGGYDVSQWPVFFGPGETWYAKPDAGKLIVSPAEEDPAAPQDAWADDFVIAEGLDRYRGFVTEEVTRLETTWAGLRTFAPDRTLVLGPAPDEPEFFWCAGQGGYGFQSAPGASQLLADLVLGRTPDFDPDIISALSPKRFRCAS